jgi:hypothetical protein
MILHVYSLTVDPCIGPKMVPVFFSKIRESFSSK